MRERLQWFLHFTECGSVSTTCRHFTIARTTFHRWARRFDPRNLATLEDLPTSRPGRIVRADVQCPTTQGLSAEVALPVEFTPTFPSIGIVQAAVARPDCTPQSSSFGPCALCRLRRWGWQPLVRTLVVASILANLSFLAILLGIAWIEARKAPAPGAQVEAHLSFNQ